MWFIDNKVIDGLALRQWMGEIAERVVAKHAARMGLVRRPCGASPLIISHSALLASLTWQSVLAEDCQTSRKDHTASLTGWGWRVST